MHNTTHPSFDYEIRKTPDGVQVAIHHYRLKRFLFSLIWSILWFVIASRAYERLAIAFSWFLFFLLTVLLASIGIFSAVRSVLSRTLTLMPSGLRVRTSFFGIPISRFIDLPNVSAFGFAHLRHSRIGVLRLEERSIDSKTKWVILATGTCKDEVNAFLQDAGAQGFQLSH